MYTVLNVSLKANPASGNFSSPGWRITDTGNGNGIYNPSIAGVGNHLIHYIKTGGGGYDVFITVHVLPVLTFTPSENTFCVDGMIFQLTDIQDHPGGGVFSFTGDGVVGSTFYPSSAGPGTHPINAIYTLNGVSNTVTVNFIVRSAPTIELVNFKNNQCQTDANYTISARDAVTLAVFNGGIYTGNGITDNTDGTAIFSPLAANLVLS